MFRIHLLYKLSKALNAEKCSKCTVQATVAATWQTKTARYDKYLSKKFRSPWLGLAFLESIANEIAQTTTVDLDAQAFLTTL